MHASPDPLLPTLRSAPKPESRLSARIPRTASLHILGFRRRSALPLQVSPARRCRLASPTLHPALRPYRLPPSLLQVPSLPFPFPIRAYPDSPAAAPKLPPPRTPHSSAPSRLVPPMLFPCRLQIPTSSCRS